MTSSEAATAVADEPVRRRQRHRVERGLQDRHIDHQHMGEKRQQHCADLSFQILSQYQLEGLQYAPLPKAKS